MAETSNKNFENFDFDNNTAWKNFFDSQSSVVSEYFLR